MTGYEKNVALNLLVAEDNSINQIIIEGFLSKYGHSFDFASDGQMAIEMVGSGSYDAVLMDVRMPELSALESAKSMIRALPPK